MKTTMLKGWKWIFTVCGLTVFLGCLNETKSTGAESSATDTATVVTASETAVDAAPQRAIIAPANLTPGIAEIVKLAQSGVGEEVLVAYVDKSGRTFNPTVDEIVYLKDLGVPEAVIASLVRKGSLTNEVAAATNVAAPTIAETNASLQPAQTVSNVAPAVFDPAAPSYSVAAAEQSATSEIPTVTPPEVNVNYFENSLSPYGSWVEVADYGRCWQPTVVVVNRNWRPYSDRGRWVYTSCGWYWQSDYSWGWAAFHYGRWHQDSRVGWVWVPGSTWGPAWVSWRYTDDYCGWAPLPPSARYVSGVGFRFYNASVGISFDFGLRDDCYTFIPTRHFCDPSPHRYYASRSHSTTIYRNSVVINNYIRGNNNTVINEGIGRNRISTATRTPIRTVALRDMPANTTPVGRAERLDRDGSIAVFRPGATRSLARSSQSSAPSANSATTPSTARLESPRTTAQRSLAPTSRAPVPSVNTTVTAPSAGSSSAAGSATTATRNAFPRTWSQTTPKTSIERQVPSTSAASSAQSTGTTSTSRHGNSVLTRQVPTANSSRSSQGQSENRAAGTISEANRQNVSPRSVPTTVTSPATPRPEIRIPTVTPSPRPQPTWRQPQQCVVADQNYGAAMQRASRSIVSAPTPSAPVPIQQAQPRHEVQMNRGLSRVESGVSQRSQPAPSVVMPRSAPAPRTESAPAPREQRGLGRSGRDRN